MRESEIRTPYLSNARFLLRHLERGVDFGYEEKLLNSLAQHGSLKLGAWAAYFSKSHEERARVLPACYRLIATQRVETDLSNLLTLDSIVKVIADA